MKYWLPTFYLLLTTCVIAQSQTLNQAIDFNTYVSATNNDLANNFSGSHQFTQTTSNGITGGAINAPAISNGEAVYNKKLKITSAVSSAAICFKYSSALLNAGNGNGDAARLKFQGDGGQYVSFTATHDHIVTQSWTVTSYSRYYLNGANLANNHWYQLKAELRNPGITSGKFYASIYLYDLGTSGTSTPALVESRLNDTVDNYFGTNSRASLTIYGEQSGGVQYLDNFNVLGTQSVGIPSIELANKISVPTIVSGDRINVVNGTGKSISYLLLDAAGRRICSGNIVGTADIDCPTLSCGSYILRISDGAEYTVKWLVKP